jgi:hypothetical protein
MRKFKALITAFLITTSVFSQNDLHQEKVDSITSTTVEGKVFVANAGFAPVPAFSFNSTIAIFVLSIKRSRFTYEPDFSLGLNGRPWMANNWFRYVIRRDKRIKMSGGINPSLFFKPTQSASAEAIIQVQRNLTFEFSSEFKFVNSPTFRFTYMRINAFDTGALSGNFSAISSSFSLFVICKVISVDVKPSLFYFNFDGNVDGFFTSSILNVKNKGYPFSGYLQGVLPIWSGFHGASFKWNVGIVYAF